MNFKDNIKKIRKDNNLSQEELADKLGVSRQSISKWEQGDAFPEMDKLITICKMFNYNMDDLMNQDISIVNETKQKNSNLNKFVDDVLSYFTKTIDMFSSMKFKQKIKCLFEQIFIAFILLIISLVVVSLLESLTTSILQFLPNKIEYTISNIMYNIYITLVVCASAFILLHIFKTRYLDYYKFVEKEDIENVEETEKEKIILDNKKEKIVIRDPQHSGYKFMSGLLKVIIFIIKIVAVFVFLGFCFSFISLVITFVLSFMFAKTGLMFIGAIITILSSLVINFLFIKILFNFIFNRKSKIKTMFITFIVSLLTLGVGIGLCMIAAKDFEVYEGKLLTKEKTITMNNNLYINDWNIIQYKETDTNDVKIVVHYYESYDPYIDINEEGDINIVMNYASKMNSLDIMRKQIEDLNNKKININNGHYTEIFTSKENIKKIQDNTNKYKYSGYDDYDDDYDE